MALMLPRQIGNLRVGERLGEGGMALVHKATDIFKPGWEGAVKLLRPEVHADADLVRRFLREGEVLTALRHPHLVEIHDFGRAGSWPYLAMELLPRGSVKACLGEAPAQIARRLLGPLEGLDVAHEAGIVHRDLKPSNLLFAADGRLKVTDFGVCLWEGDERTRLTRSQMVVGTVGFMAPEQHGSARGVDRRADIYALGAILYEFTTGQAYAAVQLPPAAARPGYPVKLARVVMQALAADPAKRIPSAAHLHAELCDWLDTAEAAGWGEAPLPGFEGGQAEGATVASRALEAQGPEARLGPYLDGLSSGPVGTRMAAGDGLLRGLAPGDEGFLLERLPRVPEGARFALCKALGRVGGEAALPALLGLLQDPYARGDAADAASRVAQRLGRETEVAQALRGGEEPGEPWKWLARARLGDEAWGQGLAAAWDRLPAHQRTQALEAAREAPDALWESLRAALRPRLTNPGLLKLLDSR